MTAAGAPLEIRVGVDVTDDGVAAGDLVRVALVNTGHAAVVVAGRLAVGYEDSTDREIYVVLRDPGTGQPVGQPAQLYHRAPHSAGDLRSLGPGDHVSTSFNLGDWYTYPAGELELQVVYDPGAVAERFPAVDHARVLSGGVRIVFSGRGRR